MEKTLWVDSVGEDVRMMLWDTAGQEEFETITRAYYRGGGACVLAFSTTDRASFDALRSWKRKVEEECGRIAMVIVQNKVDLFDQQTARPEEVEGIAEALGLRLFRASVKENLNVAEIFEYLAAEAVRLENAGSLGAPVGGSPKGKPGLPVLPGVKGSPEEEMPVAGGGAGGGGGAQVGPGLGGEPQRPEGATGRGRDADTATEPSAHGGTEEIFLKIPGLLLVFISNRELGTLFCVPRRRGEGCGLALTAPCGGR